MNKTVLERFISKYNLGGAAEAVFLTTENGKLSTKFITDDKNALGIISTDQLTFDDGNYAVYETAKLVSFLNVLDEDIRVKVNKDKSKAKSLTLSDGSTKATFILADETTIPAVPDLKKIPSFDLTITLDQKFISTFVKAKSALPEVDAFTIVADEKKAEVVLGYSSLNTNRISFEVSSDTTKQLEPKHFSARYMREILLANKEAKSGKLFVSEKGLSHVTFDIEGFSVDYYLVEIQIS